MSSSLAAPQNSTTVRSSISALPWIRAYFTVASRIVPEVARRQAERLFTAPPPYAGRALASTELRPDKVASGRHSVAVWSTGPRDAPAALLVHGWGGRGAQMRSFIEPLVVSGRRVVWFDQPGHGDSGRGSVALPDFVRAVQSVTASHGPFEAAIGHSLGAAAVGVALRAGLPLSRAVFVSSPASLIEYTHRFARMLGLTPAIRDAMRQAFERRYDMSFEDIDRIDDLGRQQLPALFVHDVYDVEVSFDSSVRLASRMPHAQLLRTYGLGHRRILRDDAVVDAIVEFVSGNERDLPTALPALPRPAPLY